MTHPIPSLQRLAWTGAALAIVAWPAAVVAATRTVDEHRPAEAAGQVEIQNVAGRIDVVGWDKPEVAVSGTIGGDGDRLEITTAGARTSVRVGRESHGISFGLHSSGTADAKLIVHVPARSSLTITAVSADVNVAGVSGNQELHTVSGDIVAAAQHDVRVRTVSGDVRLTAGPESRAVEVSTVSGDLTVAGGAGELSASTVSGDGILSVGQLTRAHFKTVSGDFSISADLAPDGRLEGESVSGDFRINFSGPVPPAAFDLESFSGDLTTCFGRKSTHEGYGPGSRLSFQEGAGTAHVRIETKSGDVTLCNKK